MSLAPVVQVVSKLVGRVGPPTTLWQRVTDYGSKLSAGYSIATPVRNPDGTIDYKATAVRYLNVARGQSGLPAVPYLDEWLRTHGGVQVIDNGDGTVTVIPPMWIHDP